MIMCYVIIATIRNMKLKSKTCKMCKEDKVLCNYTKNGPWYSHRCKDCANAYSKKYAEKRKKAKAGTKWF